MRTSHIQFRIGQSRGSLPPGHRPGILRKLATAVVGTAILVGAFMLSVVVLAVVAIAGVIGGTWLWWRTRELRKRMRENMAGKMAEQMHAREQAQGRVIEGEAVRDPN